MEEVWRIPKPAGISSRGNCVMCYLHCAMRYVLLWKLCYVHFALCYVLCVMYSRGNCAMCKVGPLKILDKDPTNCVQHTPPAKKGGFLKEFRA